MTNQMADLDTKVCNLVRALRAQNGLSIRTMASYLSVHSQKYEKMENGYEPFKVDHLIVLTKILSPENPEASRQDIEFFRQYMALPDRGKRFLRAALKTQI